MFVWVGGLWGSREPCGGDSGRTMGVLGNARLRWVYQALIQKLKTLTVLTIHEINKTPKKMKNNSIYF